jgi:hypothetical protein
VAVRPAGPEGLARATVAPAMGETLAITGFVGEDAHDYEDARRERGRTRGRVREEHVTVTGMRTSQR